MLESLVLIAAMVGCDGGATAQRSVRREGRLVATVNCQGDSVVIREHGRLAYTLTRSGSGWVARDPGGRRVLTME
jgi:hypothetical protein